MRVVPVVASVIPNECEGLYGEHRRRGVGIERREAVQNTIAAGSSGQLWLLQIKAWLESSRLSHANKVIDMAQLRHGGEAKGVRGAKWEGGRKSQC